MVDTPCYHQLATSPECHVDIFVDFTPQRGLILSFVNVNIYILRLDTVDLYTDCIFYPNLVCWESDQNELDCQFVTLQNWKIWPMS